MAQDQVSLFNLAIAAMGSRGAKVSSPDEASNEAEECRLWFEPARDQILRAAFWPSAKSYNRLALLDQRDDSIAWIPTNPEPGWQFVYGAPADMLYPRYLTTYERFTTGLAQITGGEVTAIHSSAEQPILVFTKRQTDISLWDAQLYMAIANTLSFYISGPLHGKLSFKRDAQEQANFAILQARESMANEPEDKIDVLPEWIAARGFEGPPTQNKFTFPFGPMIGAASGGGNVR